MSPSSCETRCQTVAQHPVLKEAVKGDVKEFVKSCISGCEQKLDCSHASVDSAIGQTACSFGKQLTGEKHSVELALNDQKLSATFHNDRKVSVVRELTQADEYETDEYETDEYETDEYETDDDEYESDDSEYESDDDSDDSEYEDSSDGEEYESSDDDDSDDEVNEACQRCCESTFRHPNVGFELVGQEDNYENACYLGCEDSDDCDSIDDPQLRQFCEFARDFSATGTGDLTFLRDIGNLERELTVECGGEGEVSVSLAVSARQDDEDDTDSEYEYDSDSDDSDDEQELAQCRDCCERAAANPVVAEFLGDQADTFLAACLDQGCESDFDCSDIDDEELKQFCEFGDAILEDDEGLLALLNAAGGTSAQLELFCNQEGALAVSVTTNGTDTFGPGSCKTCCGEAAATLQQIFPDLDEFADVCEDFGCDNEYESEDDYEYDTTDDEYESDDSDSDSDSDCDSLDGAEEALCEFGEDLAENGQGLFDYTVTQGGLEREVRFSCGGEAGTVLSFTENRVVGSPSEGSSAGIVVGALAATAVVVASAFFVAKKRQAQNSLDTAPMAKIVEETDEEKVAVVAKQAQPQPDSKAQPELQVSL